MLFDAGVAFNCRPRDASELRSPFRSDLLQLELDLAKAALSYADSLDQVEFRPENFYLENDGLLWVWSKTQSQQIGLQNQGSRFLPVARRIGPLKTMKCRAVVRLTLCLGEREPGGFVAVRGSFRHHLPHRAGYSDFDLDSTGRIIVYNRMPGVIYLVNRDGHIEREITAGESVDHLGFVDNNTIWSTSFNPPAISVWRLDSGTELYRFKLTAPVREALFDQRRNFLWTIGPVDKAVRRVSGPIENLQTAIYGYEIRRAGAGNDSITRRFEDDWLLKQLADGTHLWLSGDSLYASATGSNAIIGYKVRERDMVPIGVARGTGRVPQGLLAAENSIFTANRLDNTISRFSARDFSRLETISLPGGGQPADAGEAIFYDGTLWSVGNRNRFSCNSCHWNTLTDHRLHPGILETRYEMTRPLAGLRMVAPVFTPMQALSLADAVQGLFQTLDHRFWTGEIPPSQFFSEPLPGSGLSPLAGRKELLRFLMNLRPERGPLRQPDGGFSAPAIAGSRIFLRDCASCHEPSTNMRTRSLVPPHELLQRLKQGPLSFGAPLYREAGVKPYYTANGNRTTPLVSLGRGGPFFSNGSARTLGEVVERFSVTASGWQVHGATQRTGFYSAEEIDQLVEFLLSI